MNHFAQSILHWNVRGLISKCHEFKHTLSRFRPLIASIQETHFHDKDPYNFYVPGYSLLTNNINSLHRSGGVALYIADSLIHRKISIDTDLNAVVAEVILNNKPILVASVYIPPEGPPSTQKV